MDEYLLLESETLRKKFCTEENTDILYKIGTLKSFSQKGWTTTEYISKFYNVPIPTIKSIVARHKTEIIIDGYKILQKKDLMNPNSLKEIKKIWGSNIKKELKTITSHVKVRSVALFSRRATLRIGMLLRDSLVAKNIRTYLLNAEKNNIQPQKQDQVLSKMARQLTQHASQLVQNAEQLICQANLVTATISEIERTKELVKKIDNRVLSQEERICILENKICDRDGITITEYHVSILKEELKKKKNNAVSIWRKFNKHFGIKKYRNLPQSSFNDGLKWLKKLK